MSALQALLIAPAKRQVAGRVAGDAAGLGPGVVLALRRQRDGLVGGGEVAGDVLLLDDGDALAGQRHRLLGERD